MSVSIEVEICVRKKERLLDQNKFGWTPKLNFLIKATKFNVHYYMRTVLYMITITLLFLTLHVFTLGIKKKA